MKKIFFIFFLFILNIAAHPQDMRRNSNSSLFSDQKANRVGDAVTIIVVESSQASNNAVKSTSRESDLGFDLSGQVDKNPLPKVDVGIGSNNDFKGSGSTSTSGMIRTKISATIDSVLNNGNLVVRGSRKISINGEEQTLHIKGVVRNSDITAENSVLSYNLSDAEIVLEGNGLINDSQSPGWLTKFFHWIF